LKDELIEKFGKKAFVQSIKPYHGKISDEVAVFGLDTEYVPVDNQPSKLICWQLASDFGVKLISGKKLSLKEMYIEAKKMVKQKRYKTYVFVVYFAIAELQFLDVNDWVVSEFKGKYRFSQRYGDGRVLIVDLFDWYQHQSLAKVAKLWGLEKMDYPIGETVQKIEKEEMTISELLRDKKFIEYAKVDAVLCQKIYSRLREYFIKEFGVDIVSTMTPANTAASIFRRNLKESIEQHDTKLRKLALQCCWGGRMECLFRGEKELVYEYDATGHHPNSAIALKKLPLESDWEVTTNLNVWLSGISGLGRVYFKFPDDERYPCLPVYHEDALLFPLEGVSRCSVSEVRLAKEKKAKLILLVGYYYKDGTTILTESLRRFQDIRNKSSDSAERQILKLFSNSIIGKLFQKNSGVDLKKVQAYAKEHEIPFDVAVRLKGVDFEGEVTVGSCFYPEWYALILGYARANISRQSSIYKALVISSDSFVIEQFLGETLLAEGLTYNLKHQGKLVSYRTRFYRVGEKLAHHAVHSKEAAEDVLNEFKEGVFSYRYSRFTHLREALRDRKAFGSRKWMPMTTNLGFDFKRRLNEDGTTVPLVNVEERTKLIGGVKNGNDESSSS